MDKISFTPERNASLGSMLNALVTPEGRFALQRAIKRGDPPPYSGKHKTPKKQGPKQGARSHVKVDGVSSKTVTKKKKKGKSKAVGKSLTKRISALEKNRPKVSTNTWEAITFFKTPKAPISTGRMFILDGINVGHIENAIDSLGGLSTTNYTSENTSIDVSSRYVRFRMKNAITGNVKLQCFWAQCVDPTSSSYLEDWAQAIAKRYSVAALSVSAAAGETATTSRFPERVVLTNNQIIYPISEGVKGKSFSTGANWKQLSQVYTYTLGPGDTDIETLTMPRLTYRPENRDKALNPTNMPGDTVLVCKLVGDIAHDNVNKDKVGYGSHALDVEVLRRLTVRYSDGKGLRQIENGSDINAVGFTTPVHADNMASAVEQDQD